MAQNTQNIAAVLLSELDPLLHACDAKTVETIASALRKTNADSTVLSTAVYVFSKMLKNTCSGKPSEDPRVKALRAVIGQLIATGYLCRITFYTVIDAETHDMIEPHHEHAAEDRRARTRRHFVQPSQNLFRDETEGYSKVIELLHSSTYQADNAGSEQIAEVGRRLIAFIGQFSLNSYRVIELILSAAAESVAEQIHRQRSLPFDHRLLPLYSALLDEFPRDHVYNVMGAMMQCYHSVPQNSKDAKADGRRASSKAAGVNVSLEEDAGTPESLIFLIIVMIRDGRMTVDDIWHHLSPRDNRVLSSKFLEFEKNLQAISSKIRVSNVNSRSRRDVSNQDITVQGHSTRDVLHQHREIMSGPFADFSSQKLVLISMMIKMCRCDDAIASILALGVNDEHVDIAAHPEIRTSLIGVSETLLNPLLCSLHPLLYDNHAIVSEAITKLGGSANGYPTPLRSIDEFLCEDESSPGATVRRMLCILGPHANKPGFLIALCRILRGRSSPAAVEIMREVILPASSLEQSNAGLASEIWTVIGEWPHTIRWSLYGHLHNVVSKTCAAYQVVENRASQEMKYILKRLTSETQKQHMINVAKISHGQALPAFAAVIQRVQGYPADPVTISPVVECCRTCTDLAVDMLMYLIIDRMADPQKSRLKEDGINIAQWYSTLSLFLGICLRKLRGGNRRLDGVLHFFFTMLVVNEDALLITALSDVIDCVADIGVETNLTSKQLVAQGGGRVLRSTVSGNWGRLQADQAALGSPFDQKAERERSSAMFALRTAFERTGTHVPIAIAIAQLTKMAVYQEDLRMKPLKLAANLVDRTKSSLMQISQFFDSMPGEDPESYGKKSSPKNEMWEPLKAIGLSGLVNENYVPVSSAVLLMSPILDFLADYSEESNRKKAVNSDQPARDVKTPNNTETAAKGDSNADDKPPSEQLPSVTNGSGDASSPKQQSFEAWISRKSGGKISECMARTFWTLKLSDVTVPVDMYDREKKRLVVVANSWETEGEKTRNRERVRQCESEAKRIRTRILSLEAEKASLLSRQRRVKEVLQMNKQGLVSADACGTEEMQCRHVQVFLQECVLPRCKTSISDAIFCSKFVLLLLELDIPALSFSKFFEYLVKLVPVLIRGCSENEALNIASLLKETLSTLEKWRSNRSLFDTEASARKEFGFRDTTHGKESKPLRHEQYCQWLFTIHENLVHGMCKVIRSEEYLYSRNSLSILAGVADVFPKVSEHSTLIENCVEKLINSGLPDIKLPSTGVLARIRSGKAKRIPLHFFKLKPTTGSSTTPSEHVQGKEAHRVESGSKMDIDTKQVAKDVPKQLPPKAPLEATSGAVNGAKPRPTASDRKVKDDRPTVKTEKLQGMEVEKNEPSKQNDKATPQADVKNEASLQPPSVQGKDVTSKPQPNDGKPISNGVHNAEPQKKAVKEEALASGLDPTAEEFVPERQANKTDGQHRGGSKRSRSPRETEGAGNRDNEPHPKRPKPADSRRRDGPERTGQDRGTRDRGQPERGVDRDSNDRAGSERGGPDRGSKENGRRRGPHGNQRNEEYGNARFGDYGGRDFGAGHPVHGNTRGRENAPGRGAYDGGGGRRTRPRHDNADYGDRPGPRDDFGNGRDRHFDEKISSPRGDGYGPSGAAPNWMDKGRSGADNRGPHGRRDDSRDAGQRRRDADRDGGLGWQNRDRMSEYDVDRQPRPRDDGRQDDRYQPASYDERPVGRGADRGYRDGRGGGNGGRDNRDVREERFRDRPSRRGNHRNGNRRR